MTGDLIARLQLRHAFFSTDNIHWFMSPDADEDCADAITEIQRLRARVAKLEARLEIDHCFEMKDGELVRVEIPPAERDSFPDLITCQAATIDLLEDRLGIRQPREQPPSTD